MPEQIANAIASLISALPVIVGAIIGACVPLFSARISRKVAESGRLDVFCRIVFSKVNQRNFGVYKSGTSNGLVLVLPMWIEIANTAMVAKYIRDFNIVAYNGKSEVVEFVQMQGANIGKENKEEFGNHQAYSFVVDGKAIQRYNVEFALKESELQDNCKDFNILKARYYDENRKKHEQIIFSCQHPIEWKIGAIEYKREWIQVSGRK